VVPDVVVPDVVVPDVVPAPVVLASQWSHYFIFATAIFGLFWGVVQILQVNKIDIDNFTVEADMECEDYKKMTPD
jgi:hypothetical protein